ncbi:MAG: hypothetical protein ACRCUX_15365 [Beijerinckiaceae bacterium]
MDDDVKAVIDAKGSPEEALRALLDLFGHVYQMAGAILVPAENLDKDACIALLDILSDPAQAIADGVAD